MEDIDLDNILFAGPQHPRRERDLHSDADYYYDKKREDEMGVKCAGCGRIGGDTNGWYQDEDGKWFCPQCREKMLWK